MGGGAAKASAVAAEAPHPPSAPSSPARKSLERDVPLLPLDPDRPATTKENWRVTPRADPTPRDWEESKPDAAEDQSTASNGQSTADGSGAKLASSDDSRETSPGGSARSTGADHAAEDQDATEGAESAEPPPKRALPSADAEEAFGAMIAASLKSPKWDRRVESIKGIESMVKSHAIAPGGRNESQQQQIFAAMRVLEQVLRDKVFPVLAAAFSLYNVVLNHAGQSLDAQDRDAGLEVLLPVIVSRLGDTNQKIHDGATSAVLATAQNVEEMAAVCVEVLAANITAEIGTPASDTKSVARLRVCGVLSCLESLVRQQGASAETAALLAPTLPLVLDHPKEKVRIACLDVIAQFSHAGVEIPNLVLRSALEDLLQARIADLAEDDGEEIAGVEFMVVGTSIPVHNVRDPSRVEQLPSLSRSSSCRNLPGLEASAKPDLDFCDDEEALMDDILGSTGLAFQASGLITLDEPKKEKKILSDVDALEAEFLQDLEDLGTLP